MKLRKKLIALSALTLSLIMVVPVFADNPVGWQKNETGWWYGTNATGTTLVSRWLAVDRWKQGWNFRVLLFRSERIHRDQMGRPRMDMM